MLIIHNDLDFRVPVSEGLQLFTTLQRQGVPAEDDQLPRRGPLGAEAGQQRVLAPGGVRLVEEVRAAGRTLRDEAGLERFGVRAFIPALGWASTPKR